MKGKHVRATCPEHGRTAFYAHERLRYCVACARDRAREDYAAHPERFAASSRRWRERHRAQYNEARARCARAQRARLKASDPEELRRRDAVKARRAKAPRGRVCVSCGARDTEVGWSMAHGYCARCDRARLRNGTCPCGGACDQGGRPATRGPVPFGRVRCRRCWAEPCA